MISSVSNAHAAYANHAPQPAPKAQPQPSGSLPQDTVTLKSTGSADHDADGK